MFISLIIPATNPFVRIVIHNLGLLFHKNIFCIVRYIFHQGVLKLLFLYLL
ncbi:hypothetical protein FM106_11695 [Brachybacterium faecium]|nr:hypothetical protein FM106_11695 [Brachybacterium faecium]